MYTCIRTITEEIEFYQRQNFRFQMEDMLRAIEDENKIYQKQIQENKTRIENLWDSIQDSM